MGDYEEAAKRIKHVAGPAGYDDEVEYALRNRRFRAHVVIANEAARIPLMVAEKALTLVSATIISDAGMAADANSLDLELSKNDGAGGADTSFDIIDGTAEALTADQEASFTIAESTDTLAAGDVLWLEVAVNGTGDALGHCLIDVEYRLN